MGIRALQVGQTFTHISKFDKRPEEGEPGYENYTPTKWKWRVLDSRVLGVLKDKATTIGIDPKRPDDEVITHVSQNQYYFDVCALGLLEPEDFYEDEEGTKKVKWRTASRNIAGRSYEIVAHETLGKIPSEIIAELAEVILRGNEPSVEEGNASGSQSSPSTSSPSETVSDAPTETN